MSPALRNRARLLCLILGAMLAVQLSAYARAQGRQSAETHAAHSVVLVSLGGFRWDYAERDGAAHLLAIGKRGVSAPQGMLPSYPASTWPNLYTIVTGLYPGHHGIIADAFLDPVRQSRFYSGDDSSQEGPWYGGTPLWSLAEQAGIHTACIDWPGCAAQIAGARPRYIARDPGAGAETRLRQITEWLHLPEADRPRLILARFDEADEAGKKYGPDGPETRVAVRRVDALIGRLQAELNATRLPIDLVVVSDHGMAKDEGAGESLDQFADLSGFDTEGVLLYGKSEEDRVRVYNQLKKASPDFFAYRLKNLPAGLHLDGNPRMGDPIIVPTGAYLIRAHAEAGAQPKKGIDGLNPRTVPAMRAIFFAAGPDIVEASTVAPFENVNLYPWLAHLLGLTPPKTDGSLNILSGTLRDGGEKK
jgi:predicted AlkP superfamily pyrophosphatase or phosphodiesterase